MSDEVLALDSVHADHGGRPVLDGVSLRVGRGDVYALLGRNGAGKTTLIHCLLGLKPVSSGAIRLLGRDPWTERARALARVGFVSEEPDAPPALDTRALGRLAGALADGWDGAIYRELLGRAEVPADRPFATLSRGQKAHVGLALAIAARPEVLVLDDPTLGLDAVARRAFHEELIGQLAERGVTIFIASNDLAAVERIATHVGILRDGRLVMDTELEALKARGKDADLDVSHVSLDEIFTAVVSGKELSP